MSDDTAPASDANLPPDPPPHHPAGETPSGDPPHAPEEASSPERSPLEGVHLPADAILRGDVIRSDELFQGATEIHIVHCDVTSRLVITRSGKLVLRK